MNFLKNNWFWIFLIFILFTGIVKLLGPGLIRFLSSREKTLNHESPPPLPENKPAENTKTNSPDLKIPSTTIQPESAYDGPIVRYGNNSFSPSRINLQQNTSQFGCLLKIVNDSNKPLTIRLGPYEKSVKENYGQKYAPIPPGEYLLLDPRFGLKSEGFLNFEKPDEKFEVNLDTSCL